MKGVMLLSNSGLSHFWEIGNGVFIKPTSLKPETMYKGLGGSVVYYSYSVKSFGFDVYLGYSSSNEEEDISKVLEFKNFMDSVLYLGGKIEEMFEDEGS